MKRSSLIIFVFVMMSINLNAQQQYKNEIDKKLSELNSYGVQHKFLDETTIELTNTLTGLKSRKTLLEPETEAIYNWANERGIPVLEIDPTQVDTTKWTGWYDYWTYVWIGNSENTPTQIKDFDENGFQELYGIFSGIGFEPEFRIFEVYPNGSSVQRFGSTSLQGGLSTHIFDVDMNGLKEVVYLYGQDSYFYEQPDTTSLPTQLKFVFNKYNGAGGVLTREHIEYMDKDSLIDFVHRGADTSISQHYLMYVSEYNPSIQNFEKIWYAEPPIEDFWGGFDVGDYDGDKKMEFILSSIRGKLMIVENTDDNLYEAIFQDSLPLVNMYYQASGDLDGDGKREFFIGATMGNGNWTTMFESDGDNSYTPRFTFHLLSGGPLDDPTYITNDIDGDGKLEFAILSGGYLYIFKSDGDDSSYLWYLKKGPTSRSMNFYDMDGDSIKDIIWTNERDGRWVSDIFKGSKLINAIPNEPSIPDKIELRQNYPNPFNPTTTIDYSINSRQEVKLKIYDVLGREIKTLINEEKEAGTYSVEWNASVFPSGVYFYKIQTETGSITKKMLLVK